MPYDKREHHRRSIRLPAYDYTSAGVYFVTICVRSGECLLGEIVDGEMQLNPWGQIALDCWQAIPEHYPRVQADACVVMPNHVHGIITITDSTEVQFGAQDAAPVQGVRVQAGSLGAIVRSFKSAVTNRVNQLRDMPGTPFWQRNYWEHIVRNEAALNRIRKYIEDNPTRWEEDQLHPDAAPNPFNQWQM